jgi:hypothetical protein
MAARTVRTAVMGSVHEIDRKERQRDVELTQNSSAWSEKKEEDRGAHRGGHVQVGDTGVGEGDSMNWTRVAMPRADEEDAGDGVLDDGGRRTALARLSRRTDDVALVDEGGSPWSPGMRATILLRCCLGGGARAGFRSGQGRRGARPWWRAEGASVRALQTEVAHVHADVLPENTSGYGRGRA